jgi:hypothetical protein
VFDWKQGKIDAENMSDKDLVQCMKDTADKLACMWRVASGRQYSSNLRVHISMGDGVIEVHGYREMHV